MGDLDGQDLVIVMGDFNAHVGFLGRQDINQNGRMMLDFMDRWNFIMLNADDRCEGVVTRKQRGEESVLDYILISRMVYARFRCMVVDENKFKYDLSDHCLLIVELELDNKQGIENTENSQGKYYKTNSLELEKEFIEGIERDISSIQGEDSHLNIVRLESIIRGKADSILKKNFKRRTEKGSGRVEPIWITEEIRISIKKRREYNRAKRLGDEETRRHFEILYWEQKRKVQKEVKERKNEHEVEVTRAIRENKGGRDMWKMINKLGDRDTRKADYRLYDEHGVEIGMEGEGEAMERYWKEIYNGKANKIEDVWNEEERNRYEMAEGRDAEQAVVVFNNRAFGEMSFPRILVEHMETLDGGVEVEEVRYGMNRVEVGIGDIKNRLGRIKLGKQPGLDGMKGELYKWMKNSETCMKGLCDAFNGILDGDGVGERWKVSKTNMIPKVRKP